VLKEIIGNLLSADEEYVCHQCNCVTRSAGGVAQAIFAKWSYADCYATRWAPDKPGTIHYVKPSKDYRGVINMFAQYYPGSPQKADDPMDGFQMRKNYFVSCLKEIPKLKPKSLAFPKFVGCCIAGGVWEDYLKMLTKFSDVTNIPITLYEFKK
jgi:O-acetyl-ADP-ribose deacetylase (regulator of RNase III)